MNSNDKLAESMRALADAWRQSDSPIAQVHAALLDGALAAAPAPSEPAEAVGIVHIGNLVWKIDAHAPDGSLLYVRPQTEPAPDHIPGVGEMVAARQPRQKEID